MSFWTRIVRPVLKVAAVAAATYFTGGAAAAALGGGALGAAGGAAAGALAGGATSGALEGGPPDSFANAEGAYPTSITDPSPPTSAYQVAINGSTPGPSWIPTAIGAGGALATGALNAYGQQQTNAANAEQAQRQMDFQNQQTSTSYQRGVLDMEKAGLNPMLAYSQGGASSGNGAQAVMGNAVGAGANSALSGLETISGIRQTLSNADNLDAVTNRTKSETALNALRAFQVEQDTNTSAASAEKLRADRELALATLKGTLADSDVKENTVGARTSLAEQQTRGAAAGATLSELEAPRARNEARSQDSWWMREVAPYANSAGQAARGIRGLIKPF